MKQRFQSQPKVKLAILNIRRSFGEFLINFFFSIIPLLVGVVVLAAIDRQKNDFLSNVKSNWPMLYSDGELFAYCIAALAPVIYISAKVLKHSRYFTIAVWFIVISLAIALFASVFIAVNISSDNYNAPSLVPVSIVFFIASFFMLFCALMLNNLTSPENQMNDSSRIIREADSDFSKQFRER